MLQNDILPVHAATGIQVLILTFSLTVVPRLIHDRHSGMGLSGEPSRETIKRQKTMDPGSKAYREDDEVRHTGMTEGVRFFALTTV